MPQATLQQLTGHRSLAMLDLYDHPTMADRVKALEPSRAVLDEIWGSHEAKAKG